MKVLIATDGSEPALRACQAFARLAREAPADVRILTVLSYDTFPYALVPGEHLSNEAEMEVRVRTTVEEISGGPKQLMAAAGHEVTVRHRFGNPGDEIIAEIHEFQPDLVVIGRRGVKGLERWIGSVSEHVLHHSKVPILLVP